MLRRSDQGGLPIYAFTEYDHVVYQLVLSENDFIVCLGLNWGVMSLNGFRSQILSNGKI